MKTNKPTGEEVFIPREKFGQLGMLVDTLQSQAETIRRLAHQRDMLLLQNRNSQTIFQQKPVS